MRALSLSDRPGRLAWLALSGLGIMASVLAGSAWIAVWGAELGATPQRLVDACLLLAQSLAEGFWSWTAAHPLAALVLAFLAASMAWALIRLGVSLLAGWRLRRRLSMCEPGQFPLLDRALRLAPEVEPAQVRIFYSMTPDAFTIGLIRPKICLSAGLLRSLKEPEIQAVLRHEHAHVVARDPIRLAVVRFLSDFLWFLPIARTLAGAFTGLAELRADQVAVAAGSDSLELASAIVKTAKGSIAELRLAPALGGLPWMERRVMQLLGRERAISLRIPWGRGLASALIIMAFPALVVGPALGTESARELDPMAAMHSLMMNCSRQNGVGANHLMNQCGAPGTVPPGIQKGYGT